MSEAQKPEVIEEQTPVESPAKPEPAVSTSVQDRQTDISLRKAEARELTATSVLDPVAFAQMKALAADLIAGGAATPDAKTPEQLLVKMQAGWEMGMKPIEAINSLYIVNGRVTIWGSALIRQLRKRGWSVLFKDESPETCTIKVTHGDEVIEDTFKYADADASGYTKDATGKLKVGWRDGQNRKLKMRYGAASQLVKTYLPEVLGSIAGVAEIDQDAPLIIEGDVVVDSSYPQRIAEAVNRDELANILRSLPVTAQKQAVPLVEARMAELLS